MQLSWHSSESTIRPVEIDTQSSLATVYLRKNIREITREEIGGNTITMYEYLEAVLTPIEYQAYISEKQRADIDYIALMTDVDLEEE